ncbi:TPA: ATP-dependent helicase [Burkholderia vietnamiensis]|uniref:ATP-dependent helicase n=1 Tax=Burkholderia vietnamiensis TaxID=60552 RepID=UPI001B9E3E01|nr:ATP-dependent helicase [Burkholderia vietnamiensis]MBR7914176.1 ATP-dependent helicase [Burkholderia vietnamiensis]HDR9278457.1 ATP-dependent helicase [Burkholderia vietnamiensis]
MPSRKESSAYLQAAEQLRKNDAQWAAYESKGHCIVTAGPGSGKTKTLVLKLARILAEDVRAPRGVACITFSQECARELSRRLDELGLRESSRLFIGTVHGFCLRHLLMPYANLAGLELPGQLAVATQAQTRDIFRTVSEAKYGIGHPYRQGAVDNLRRTIADRTLPAWHANEELAALAELYEIELHRVGLVDFEDLVRYGTRLVREHDWVLPLIRAKFPVLAVDEYQDLGASLHQIVKRLAFDGGVRLFAVGDPDQSIYGFNGADSKLLEELTNRKDVESVRLEINYRSAEHIVRVAERALGEPRGYKAFDETRSARVVMVKCPDGLASQAQHAVSKIVQEALASKPGRQLGDIAILYRTAELGDIVAEAATNEGLDFIRVDNAAPYRKCTLTSWIEDCAAWCSGGWGEAKPRLQSLLSRYASFRRRSPDERTIREESRRLTEFLWNRRGNGVALDFVSALRTEMLDAMAATEATLADQMAQVNAMSKALAKGGAIHGLDMARLGGRDGSPDHLNLLTLHSAKGCEYDVVVMLGLDEGVFPWSNEEGATLAESRRLFYVGLTRARDAVHMLYSGWTVNKYGRKFYNGRSRFLDELAGRKEGG